MKTTGTAFMTVGDMFNLYNYNTRSELIGANRYFGDDLEDTGDPVGLQSFGYAYDNIGNRTSVTNSGDVTSYTPNNLNQYTQRQISEMINLRGSAETGATVTVKMGSSQSESVTRQSKYWHKQLTSTNDTEAQYPLIKVVGVAKNAATNGDDIVTIETGHVFVAKTPEQFTYDEDGNLLSDGRWEYTWNGENRLISMETSTNVPASVPAVYIEFTYDYQGRRASKTVYEWDTTNWLEQCESTFLYDGFNLVSETTIESSATNVSSFVFGLDLSGSLEDSGGVGGLLAEIDDGEAYFPCFDANGNISEYVSTNGTIVAHREYSPFGKTIVSSGTKKTDFTHWFSTEPFEKVTGLVLYEYRTYIPDLGRFGSRDPIEDVSLEISEDLHRADFGALYSFCGNCPPMRIDLLGLAAFTWSEHIASVTMKKPEKPYNRFKVDNKLYKYKITVIAAVVTGPLLTPTYCFCCGDSTMTVEGVDDFNSNCPGGDASLPTVFVYTNESSRTVEVKVAVKAYYKLYTKMPTDNNPPYDKTESDSRSESFNASIN